MKCPNCGSEFYEPRAGACPSCGKPLTGGPGSGSSRSADDMVRERVDRIWGQAPTGETDTAVQIAAQISVAVNTRRIALVLILFVALTILTNMIALAINVFNLDPTGARILFGAWLLVSLLTLAYGLYFIVYRKGLTRL